MDGSKLLQAVFDTAIDGILIIDKYGVIESFNAAASVMFGYKEEEVIGKNVSILMPDPDKSRHDHYLKAYRTTGQRKVIGIGREVTALKKDGSRFPIRLAVSEVDYNQHTIFAGFIHDLSKQKEAEEQLKNYTLKLETIIEQRTKSLVSTIEELHLAKDEVSSSLEKEKMLNQMKSRFVSMASHEFRTPLSSILLSTEFISRYTESGRQAAVSKHLHKIQSAVTNLTTILNDFLSLERLEAGKVTPTFKDFNLIELAEEVIEEMQLIAKENQSIIYHHTGENVLVFLDPNLVRNCLINLISNAIKYSGEQTFIQLSTEISDDLCLITVSDNGIGIPVADQAELFQPFFRAHNIGNIPGTGLGLNIVKRYAELTGGKVEFESEVNKGTCFVLTFKLNVY